MSTPPEQTTARSDAKVAELIDSISGEKFGQWYRERQYRKNIEEGRPYFNGPRSTPEPERHSPGELLQCHRKIAYRQASTPAERSEPTGIFWIGTRFEEDLIVPFLERSVTGAEEYIRNTIWVDIAVETEGMNIRIKGSTDPVVVDGDSVPILLTEIKTKSSVGNLTSPNRHHLAQTHAYMEGLSRKYEIDLRDAAILYGSRNSFDVKVFHVEFDEKFWTETVLEWARDHTIYRLEGELPPANPEYDWECEFCEFKERCGKGDSVHEDLGVSGFLPRFRDYPRENVVDYLNADPDARLTPTLAEEHPDLAERFDVRPWRCPRCGSEFEWNTPELQDNTDPLCPVCAADEFLIELNVPIPTAPGENSDDKLVIDGARGTE